MRRKRRPGIGTILVAAHLVLLLLPVGGIAFLRLYESALVRQTESELIGQAAFLSATYRAAIREALGPGVEEYGRPAPAALARSVEEPRWRPRAATLDLAVDEVAPPPPRALEASAPPDPRAVAAGREILSIMRDAQVVTLAAIRVVDPDGTVVASTGEALGRSLAGVDEIARALAGEPVSRLRRRISDEPAPPFASLSRGSPLRVFVAMPVVEQGRIVGAVMLSRTPRTIGETLWGKRVPLAVSAVVLLGAMITLTALTTLGIRRPLFRLLEQTRRASEGRKGAVVPLSRPVTAEVAELSEGVAAMARALEERADALRGFAAQASHALKTPLAGLRGALELLVDHAETMTPEERARFLANVTADVERLERLVRRLLDLARADASRPGGERCSLDDVVARVAAKSRAHGIRVTVAPSAAPLEVAVAEELVESVMLALIENAVQHGGANVSIVVETASLPPGGGPGRAVLVVGDDGPGVAPDAVARLFEPFFTTDRAGGGTGLGLAIVDATVRRHGGAVTLLPSTRGARFRVELPLDEKGAPPPPSAR